MIDKDLIMKNMTPGPAVLLYNLQEGDRAERIRRYLQREGIRLIDVYPAEYNQSIGALLGLPGRDKGAAPYMGKTFSEEMLVMFGFTDAVMEQFFAFFRQEGIPSVGLKAVLTPTNAAWTSLELYAAISEEHRQMQARK